MVLSKALLQNTEEQVDAQAQLLLEMMEAVREYTNTQINPLLNAQASDRPKFMPQTIPHYSAVEVFEQFRQDQRYHNYLYKAATLNPFNQRNKADNFETDLVTQFSQKEDTHDLFGFRNLFDEQVFYSARPSIITNESCLRCHRAIAPQNITAVYGSTNDFGWQLNQVVGTDLIYVPVEKVFNSARQSLILVMGIFIGIFALILLLINWLLRQYVIRPVGYMGDLALKISGGGMSPEDFEHKNLNKIAARSDELGHSARLFLKMAREVYEREQRLTQQVQQLRIEIDQAKKSQQVSEIVESDYFQALQKKARELRKRGGQSNE